MLADTGRSISKSVGIKSQREQNVVHRNLARFDTDGAHAVGERTHRGAQHPGPFGVVGFKPKDDAAPPWPRQARVDAVECPTLAVAPIVNDQIAVFEAQFTQIVAVESGLPERIDPRHDACELLELCTQGALRIGGRGWLIGRGNIAVGRGGRDRPLVGSGKNGQPPIGFDTDRHFRPDEIEALGTQLANDQTSARKADFGFRGTCDHRSVGIAHHDVAEPQ